MRKCKKMNKALFSKRNVGYWGNTPVITQLSVFDYGVILKVRRGILPWVSE